MTITSPVAKTGNLPGNSTTFTYSFSPMVIYTSSDVEVYLTVTATGDETLLVEGVGASNYSVSLAGSAPSTGTITYPADQGTALASTSTITIKKKLVLEQQTELVKNGTYDAKVLEDQLDKIVGMIVQQQEEIDRCLKIPVSDAIITNTELNTDALRTAGHHLLISSDASTFTSAALSSGTAGTASDATPAAVNLSAGSSGSGANFSRSDHAHLLPTTVPTLATENTFTETQIWTKGSDVASGAALSVGAGNWFDVTGTTTITSIATVGIGTLIILHFDGALTLTHNATEFDCIVSSLSALLVPYLSPLPRLCYLGFTQYKSGQVHHNNTIWLIRCTSARHRVDTSLCTQCRLAVLTVSVPVESSSLYPLPL